MLITFLCATDAQPLAPLTNAAGLTALTPIAIAQDTALIKSLMENIVSSSGGQAAISGLNDLKQFVSNASGEVQPVLKQIMMGMNTFNAFMAVITNLKAQGESDIQIAEYFITLLLPAEDAAAINMAINMAQLLGPLAANAVGTAFDNLHTRVSVLENNTPTTRPGKIKSRGCCS